MAQHDVVTAVGIMDIDAFFSMDKKLSGKKVDGEIHGEKNERTALHFLINQKFQPSSLVFPTASLSS